MVRALEEKDIEEVLAEELAAFGRGSREELVDIINLANYIALVYEENFKVVGYLTMLVVDDLAEIIEVTIKKEFRGRGFAKALLEKAYLEAKKLGKVGLHLEVRETNEAARKLYLKFGFDEIFIRKKYYDGKEDAVIMQLRF